MYRIIRWRDLFHTRNHAKQLFYQKAETFKLILCIWSRSMLKTFKEIGSKTQKLRDFFKNYKYLRIQNKFGCILCNLKSTISSFKVTVPWCIYGFLMECFAFCLPVLDDTQNDNWRQIYLWLSSKTSLYFRQIFKKRAMQYIKESTQTAKKTQSRCIGCS